MSTDTGNYPASQIGLPLLFFRAYLGVNQAGGVGLPFVKIKYDTISFDQYGCVNAAAGASQGVITPPPGMWMIVAKTYVSGGGQTQQGIWKNGTQVSEGTYGPGDGTNSKNIVEDLLALNGTDALEVRSYGSAGGTYQSGSINTYVYGVRWHE
jgi:hypothetical protein